MVALPGEKVATGIDARGRTSTHPSGDGLAYLVYDAHGGVIGTGRIPVAADGRSDGTFAAPVSFLAGAGGPGRIEIVDVHQGDGSALGRASVQVLLEASEAARRPAPQQPVPQQPVPQQIVLETPVTGAAVGTSVEVRGWISTVPFENNLTYRVYSEGGAVMGRAGSRWKAISVNAAHSRSRSPSRAPEPLARFASRFETSSKPMVRCSPAPRSRCCSSAAALRRAENSLLDLVKRVLVQVGLQHRLFVPPRRRCPRPRCAQMKALQYAVGWQCQKRSSELGRRGIDGDRAGIRIAGVDRL